MSDRTILIADDSEITRNILKRILEDEYNIIEAENGTQVIETIKDSNSAISAVLLDICMPERNGFEVLERLRAEENTAMLPVIMITATEAQNERIRALALGANDFITKPYNADIIKHCLYNNIALYEASETVNELRRDKLTGLLNREAFFDRVGKMCASHEPGYYVMASFDINRFKIINDQYGTRKGDEVLKHLASVFREGFDSNGGICCRISADNFAAIYPSELLDTEILDELRRRASTVTGIVSPLNIRVGRYRITSPRMAPSAMFDRAMLAAESVKGRYDKIVGEFDESMRNKLINEQQMVLEMEAALDSGQFEVWYQPLFNHSSGMVIGAEALVRWRHPQKQIISPGSFIPVFERNGFIYSLDKYVWEQVCILLQKQLEQNENPPAVSINISRYDLFQSGLVDVIKGLTEKYGLSPDMLRLEITESAFVDSTDTIIKVVKQLINYGFTVEIDDFGSGYSSLNTLKDVPAQVLKLDMKFLESAIDAGRGGSIIESVVRMAKWLGMSVIAEGVESLGQANYLKSVGCRFVQGYLYARPMPQSEYENFVSRLKGVEHVLLPDIPEHLSGDAIWDPMSFDTLIFNSFVGSACIFEYHAGSIEMLRTTEQYIKLLGKHGVSAEDLLKIKWHEHMSISDRKKVLTCINKSMETHSSAMDDFVFTNLPGCNEKIYLKCSIRVISAVSERYIVYCQTENITEKVAAENMNVQLLEQLRSVLSDAHSGIVASYYNDDGIHYIFSNDRYFDLIGVDRAEYEKNPPDVYSFIHPLDRERVREVATNSYKQMCSEHIEYRIIKPNEEIIWVEVNISTSRIHGVEENVQLVIISDITARKIAEQQLEYNNKLITTLIEDMPGGFSRTKLLADGTLLPIYADERLHKLLELFEKPGSQNDDVRNVVHPDDIERLNETVRLTVQDLQMRTVRLRIKNEDGSWRWMAVSGRLTENVAGEKFLNIYYTDISSQLNVEIKERELLDNLTYGAALFEFDGKELVSLHHNRRFWELVKRDACYGEQLPNSIDMVFPEDREMIYNEIIAAIRNNRDMLTEFRTLCGDGEYRFFRVSAKWKRQSDNKYIIYAVYTPEDDAAVSYRQLLTTLLYAVMKSTSDIAYIKDTDYKYICVSRTASAFMGADNENDITGKTDYDVFEKDTADIFRHDDEQMIKTGEPYIDKIDAITAADGKIHYITTSKYVLRDSNGNTIGLYGVSRDISEARDTDEQLYLSREENNLAMRLSGSIICTYDYDKRRLVIGPQIAKRYGLPETMENVPEAPIKKGFIAQGSESEYRKIFEKLEKGEECENILFRQKFLGTESWLNASAAPVFGVDGKPVRAVIAFADVTEQLEKETVYKKWKQSLAGRAADSYTLIRTNLSKNMEISNTEGTLLAYTKVSLPGFNFDRCVVEYAEKYVCEQDRKTYVSFMNTKTLIAKYNEGIRSAMLEYREQIPGAEPRWIRITAELVEFPGTHDIEGYFMCDDINDEKLLALRTKERSETDPLTGVLNRITFTDRVKKVLSDSPSDEVHALIILDIDGFKQINDVFGHAAGDQMLIDTAESLGGVLRHTDLLGRLGGDEFIVFLNDIKDRGDALRKAHQICEAVRKPMSEDIRLSGSVGVAIAPDDGNTFEQLYRNADTALYSVKDTGKDNFAAYNAETDASQMPHEYTNVPRLAKSISGKKRKMLIAVNDNDDYKFISDIFNSEFTIERARDGESALIRINHYGSSLSVVLLDIGLRGTDCLTVVKSLRRKDATMEIPIIVINGKATPESGLAAVRAGASDFIPKPIDSQLLRMRLYSAISKAENERLRAQNSHLKLLNDERIRYETALSGTGLAVIEYDWLKSTFFYSDSVSHCLYGKYDDRKLWRILLSDMVADTATVQRMQVLVHRVAEERMNMRESITVKLKTPDRNIHSFRMTIRKIVDEYGLTNKLIITLLDLEFGS